jgi:hypothetical protein
MDSRFQKQRYTLSDVYNAARFERNFNFVFWLHITLDIIGENVIGYGGKMLVLFASMLIAIITILGYAVVLPAVSEPGSLAYILQALFGKRYPKVLFIAHSRYRLFSPFVNVGAFMVFSIYFNYYMAAFTDPGSPSDSFGNCGAPVDNINDNMCKKCNFSKPLRTHHCSICNRCVLKMDHHCPWYASVNSTMFYRVCTYSNYCFLLGWPIV